MTLPRYAEICRHWKRVPPLAVSAQAIAVGLGAMKQSERASGGSVDTRGNDRQALMDLLGGGGSGFRQEKPEWLQATTK